MLFGGCPPRKGKKQQVGIFHRNICVGISDDAHTNKMATDTEACPSMEMCKNELDYHVSVVLRY